MIKKAIAFITKREMVKHMAVLAGGTAIDQALSFAASPLLSRLFTEADYGKFGVFSAVVSYCVAAACLRLENAIVLPKDDSEARSIAQWCIRLNSYVSLATFVGTGLGILFFSLPYYLIVVAPTVFFMALVNTFNYYSSRQKTYKHNSRARILSSIGMAILSIVLGYVNFGAFGLVLGMFFGQLLAALYLLKEVRVIVYQTTNTFSWKALKAKYKQFIFINTPHALFDLTESAGVVLLMGAFFEPAFVGAYFFAFRILKLPLGLIGSAIYQVFYREVSEKVSHSLPVETFFNKMLFRLLAMSLPIFLILFFFSEGLFTWIFGKDWTAAGRYAGILAPWFWLNFAASSISCMPIVLNKQKQAFVLTIINTIVKVLITLICGFYYSFETLIVSYAISHTFMMLVGLLWYFWITKQYSLKLNTHLK